MGLTLKRKEAIKMLNKIGATFEEGGRHQKVSLEIDGKTVFRTVLSRGSKDIPTGTARSIVRGNVFVRPSIRTRSIYHSHHRSTRLNVKNLIAIDLIWKNTINTGI